MGGEGGDLVVEIAGEMLVGNEKIPRVLMSSRHWSCD
jgi:hypothetical protein